MTKREIKLIAEYMKDLEEGFYEWDGDSVSMQIELPELYCTIKTLMDETFKTEDQQLKVLLASLEYKARKCKDCIDKRLVVWN